MTRIPKKRGIALLLFMVLIVAADQVTKLLTVKYIPPLSQVPVIPGVVHLTCERNDGAAFSMLSGMRWLFLLLVVVYFGAIAILLRKGVVQKPTELWCLAAIGGGALGNGIDRLLTGKVVDMIEPEFVNFAVFNVADCFITCGAVVLVVYLLFFDRPEGGNRTKDPESSGNGAHNDSNS